MSLARKSTFIRGVKLPGYKFSTENEPITVLPPPEKVFIPISRHIGKTAKPIVGVGEKVKKGQQIAVADGFVSANYHASVSGTVKSVSAFHTARGKADFIVIENDFSDEEVLLEPVDESVPEQIVSAIKNAGIIGLGGAGFPTHVKFSPQNAVDTLIVNCAECEPFLTCDHRVLDERLDEVVAGARLASKALKDTDIVFGVEENKPQIIRRLATIDGVKVVPLVVKYPQGSEKQLIYACTGRKVPLGKLPASTGVVVSNAQTILKIYECVKLCKPLTDRVMTVSFDGKSGKNLSVPVGTPLSVIKEFCGTEDDYEKIIAGGPMMGRALSSLNDYTGKADSGLLFLKAKTTDLRSPTACINCARCASVCPMLLSPMYIDLYTVRGEYEKAALYGAEACFECGACAYVCPAKRDIVGSARIAKAKLKGLKR